MDPHLISFAFLCITSSFQHAIVLVSYLVDPLRTDRDYVPSITSKDLFRNKFFSTTGKKQLEDKTEIPSSLEGLAAFSRLNTTFLASTTLTVLGS